MEAIAITTASGRYTFSLERSTAGGPLAVDLHIALRTTGEMDPVFQVLGDLAERLRAEGERTLSARLETLMGELEGAEEGRQLPTAGARDLAAAEVPGGDTA